MASENSHPLESPQPEIVSTREGYDRWATFYDEDDNPLIKLEEPVIERLIGNCRGKTVLDVGCGTGRWSCKLAAAGARVTAFDFSHGMLSKAQAKTKVMEIQYVVHDIANDLPFVSHAFDCVTCCLVLDHVTDLVRLFREMGRVCKPDGFIVASTLHPAMLLKGTQARFRDPQTGRETRPKSETHQICDYVMAISHSNLRIDAMEEHSVDSELASRSPRSVKYLGWPVLLAMRLRL